MDLDLSKAVEAAAAAKWEREMEPAWSSARDGFRDPFRRTAEQDIRAALPHILDALAENADEEGPGDEHTYMFVDWLRDKAQEAAE